MRNCCCTDFPSEKFHRGAPGTGFRFWFATEDVSFAALWKNGAQPRKRWQGLGKLWLQGSQQSCRQTHLGGGANTHLGCVLVRRFQNGRQTVRVWDIMMP
jgi:hypothetical protein